MTRLIVLVAVIVAFCAGAMVDRVARGPGSQPDRPHGGPASWIGSQLNLTADQQEKMKDIWSSVFHHGSGPGQYDKRQDLRHQQEVAIAALIHDDDKPAYDKIVADTKAKLDAIDADNKKSFDQAVAKTKSILTPEQLKKYEQIVQRPWDHHDHDRPASRPGDQ